MTQSFDNFFYLRLNKGLHKQSWGWWFGTPSYSLWRQCNAWPLGGLVMRKTVPLWLHTHAVRGPHNSVSSLTHDGLPCLTPMRKLTSINRISHNATRWCQEFPIPWNIQYNIQWKNTQSKMVASGTNWVLNTLRPRQNGRHFPDDMFKCIFLNENVWIVIKFSLKFVPKCSINNIPALVQIMAWRRPGDNPLSEPMMVILLTHICVTRPQWVNTFSLF